MTTSQSESKTAGTGKKRRGRPPMLTPVQRESLRSLALEHPRLSLPDLARLFEKEESVRLTPPTLRKYLLEAGLKRSRPASIKSARPSAPATDASADPPRYTAAHRDEGDDDRYPHGLTDAEWALVRDIFEHGGPGRPPSEDRRNMVDACIYVLRSGCPWRMLPKDFPKWNTVYTQFRRWSDGGLFERMHDQLRAMWRQREHRAVEPTASIVDAQSVRSSAQGGPSGFDAGKKIKGRKRHLVTDTLGLILAVLITAANVQDRDAAEPVTAMAKAKYPTITKGWADSGYGGKVLDAICANVGIDFEVVRHPANRNVGQWHEAQGELPGFERVRGFQVLPRRWVIERTNAWTDRCRRLQKEHDRRLDVSTSWVWSAHARQLLRRLTGPDATVSMPA